MGKALYRKYRSKKLSEIVGQEHITRTLENALKQGKISHAYLFTGPRGVGKTSIARILAHEINGLPYSEESTHLDIIEIDAASNNSVEDIRSLREKVHVAPTSSKYKVYIIDEVHMLSKSAFNALLKTLEEPPAHAVFILATTEIHKLPETIVSRTQRFTFKLIEDKTIASHLASIAKAEGMKIDSGALEILAEHGRGSFRDSISLLDQVGNSASEITRDDVERLIGLASSEHVRLLLEAALEGTPANVLASIDRLVEDGVSPSQASKQLASDLRKRILEGKDDRLATSLLGNLLEVSASADPAAKLEVVLLQANFEAHGSSPAKVATEPVSSPVIEEKPKKVKAVESPGKKQDHDQPAEQYAEKDPSEPATVRTVGEPAEWWDEVLKDIKNINNTLYSAMRMAIPSVDGDTLHLGFKFKLHAKKAGEAEVQQKLHEAISKVTGRSFQITAVVDDGAAIREPADIQKTPAAPKKQGSDGTPPSSVINVFGGGEVLES